jgi:hypothetical protein
MVDGKIRKKSRCFSKIGENVAELVEDGAIYSWYSAVPDAVYSS